jgi:hypothetical protein
MTWPLDVFEAALRDAFQFASEDKGADLSGKRKLAKALEQAAYQSKYGPGGPWWATTT